MFLPPLARSRLSSQAELFRVAWENVGELLKDCGNLGDCDSEGSRLGCGDLDACFLGGVTRFGCEATRPRPSGVPVMKTRSRS